MKQRSFYFFLIMLFMGACLAEQDNELLVPTCHDGIQNQDETEIDCGGRCIECEVIIPVITPCASTLTDDTYTWKGVNYSLTDDNVGCYDEVDYFRIFIIKDGQEVWIHFPSIPTEDKIYHARYGFYPEGDDAFIGIFGGFLDYRSGAGDIYVHVSDGIITAEFCDVMLGNEYEDPRAIKGRITCN